MNKNSLLKLIEGCLIKCLTPWGYPKNQNMTKLVPRVHLRSFFVKVLVAMTEVVAKKHWLITTVQKKKVVVFNGDFSTWNDRLKSVDKTYSDEYKIRYAEDGELVYDTLITRGVA